VFVWLTGDRGTVKPHDHVLPKVADIHDTATSDIVQNRKFSCNLLKKRVLSTNREYFNKSASKKLKKWVFVTLI